MLRTITATLAALLLVVALATPALARPAGVQGGDSMLTVCRYSVAARLGLSPTDPRVVSYCLAWINGLIVTPPTH